MQTHPTRTGIFYIQDLLSYAQGLQVITDRSLGTSPDEIAYKAGFETFRMAIIAALGRGTTRTEILYPTDICGIIKGLLNKQTRNLVYCKASNKQAYYDGFVGGMIAFLIAFGGENLEEEVRNICEITLPLLQGSSS